MKLIKAVGLIDDLAAAVARDELSGLSYSVVKRYIMRQDAVDAVEVVRCKDCKHWVALEECGHYCSHWGNIMTDTLEDDFCSNGERREP